MEESSDKLIEGLEMHVEQGRDFARLSKDLQDIHQREDGVFPGMHIYDIVVIRACKQATREFGENNIFYVGGSAEFKKPVEYLGNMHLNLSYDEIKRVGEGVDITTTVRDFNNVYAVVKSHFRDKHEVSVASKEGYEKVCEFSPRNEVEAFFKLFGEYDEVNGKTRAKSLVASAIAGYLSQSAREEILSGDMIFRGFKWAFPNPIDLETDPEIDKDAIPKEIGLYKKEVSRKALKFLGERIYLGLIAGDNEKDYARAEFELFKRKN